MNSKFVIVGCGAVVKRFYLPFFKRNPRLTITGVADRDSNAAAELAKELGARCIQTEDICSDLGTVIVATPPSSHYEICSLALRRGCNVLVEKPMVGNLRDAIALCEQANRNGVQLYVGQFRRLFPGVQLARTLVARGAVGQVMGIDMFEGGILKWQPVSDYLSRDRFGGVLLDTGAHTVDMALFAAGLDRGLPIVRIGKVARDKEEPAHSLTAEFQVQMASNNVDCKLSLSRYHTLANRVRIRGDRGWVDVGVEPGGSVRIGGDGNAMVIRQVDEMQLADSYFENQMEIVVQGTSNSLIEGESFLAQMSVLDELVKHHA